MSTSDSNTPASKVCTKCGQEFPATTEYFYLDRGRLRAACKKCKDKHDRASIAANRERYDKYQSEYRFQHAEQARAKSKAWREANPERQKANNLAWRKANPDHEREQKREYRAANREKVAAWFRQRYLAHREEAAAYNLVYRAANRDRVRMWARQGDNMRRARKQGLVVSRADYREILAEHGMVCHICGDEIQSIADLHFDHVVSLAKGGSHTKENIRPSHAVCNQRKGARALP